MDRYKLLAFVLSAALAWLAGATRTVVLGFETLADVHWTMSALVVLMTLGESVGMVTGLIFIVCVLLFRRGIVGEIGALLERGRKRAERT